MRRVALMVIAVASALPAASLTYLVPKSDAIVVGSLAGQMHSVGVRAYSFRLLVERTLTGSLSGGSVIDVTFSSAHQTWGPGTLADTSRGIWFLQQSSDGKWSCLPASSHGNLVLLNELPLPITSDPLPAALRYEPATTSFADQIVYELAAAQPRDPSLILRATYDVDSQAVTRALRYMSASQSGDWALVGLAGMLQRGDVPSLLRVEQISSGLNDSSRGGSEIVSAIETAFRNTDVASIACLGRLATSAPTPGKLRRASIFALRAIHTAQTLVYLGTLLEDPSLDVRLAAAQGLSCFANGVGIVTPAGMPSLSHLNLLHPSDYTTENTMAHIGAAGGHEEAFLAYWQAWWQHHPELRN